MNTSRNRTITNPIIGDTITFVKTSVETKGQSTLCEIELPPNAQGTPPHFHNAYSETFTVIEGELTVTVDGKIFTLKKGETATAPAKALHSFTNKTGKPIKATLEVKPGHQGFEDSLYILCGCANDGLSAKNGLPKKLSHMAVCMMIADTRLPGIMSLFMPIMKLVADRAKKNGVEKVLIEKYCR